MKIVTPLKTYDPLDSFDEEYFEFGLFMSRREYKAINRRLQSGRIASVREGKFTGSTAPYGYRRRKLAGQKGFTLDMDPAECETVRLIFSLYTRGKMGEDGTLQPLGSTKIAAELSALHILSPTGHAWSAGTCLLYTS